MRERDIFISALGAADPLERRDILDLACGPDDKLRREVEGLLAEHQRGTSFILDSPPLDLASTIEPSVVEQPGTIIGPYKLLQQIGEGGMGVVFMAEQTRPIQRTVALKIIKPGMDTRQVIARFEAERQALAMMDHPSIAKVFDAGTTAGGRPYFVMELVRGVPITRYCDERRLPLRDRLGLFVPVCQAVQHAHQKGIIHRDLKPSNILIAEYDDRALPKVIDFGVAKAMSRRLTERTIFTEFGQIIGTVEYMSPEQAKFNQLDVDTRSDIYSLGVVLYELLTGSTPMPRSRLSDAALNEVLQIIREEEPPKPSVRLSTSATLPAIAANRGAQPAKLSCLVRGELDWMVMKALEKDRNRRYETASALVADVERYLRNEPVVARPPSIRYSLRKYWQRNRGAIAVATAVASAVAIAVAGVGWGIRDRAAQQEILVRARRDRVARSVDSLNLVHTEVVRLETARRWEDALAVARQADPLLASDEIPDNLRRRAEDARRYLETIRALEMIRSRAGTVWGSGWLIGDADFLRESHSQADQQYASALSQAGFDLDALAPQTAAQRLREFGVTAAAVFPVIDDWIAARSTLGDRTGADHLTKILAIADPDPWRAQVRQAMAEADGRRLLELASSEDAEHQPAATLCLLSAALQSLRGPDDAANLKLLRTAQARYPDDYWINHRLGTCLVRVLHRFDLTAEGIGYLRAAIAVRPDDDFAVVNLANALALHGHEAEAVAYFQRAKEIAERQGSKSDYAVALGKCLFEVNRRAEALESLEARRREAPQDVGALCALSVLRALAPERELRDVDQAVACAEHAIALAPNNHTALAALGIAHYQRGEWKEAADACIKSLASRRYLEILGFHEALTELTLAGCLWKLDHTDEARKVLEDALARFQVWPANDDASLTLRAEVESMILGDAAGIALGLAERGRWAAAADAFMHSAHRRPGESLAWLRAASLHLYLGHRDDYVECCREMLARFSSDSDPFTRERVAKVCALAPQSQDVVAKLGALLTPQEIAKPDDWFAEWFALAKGLAALRADDFPSARMWLARCRPQRDFVRGEPSLTARHVAVFACQALVENRAGDFPAAAAALNAAQALVSSDCPDFATATSSDADAEWGWYNWIHALVLLREAEQEVVSPRSALCKN